MIAKASQQQPLLPDILNAAPVASAPAGYRIQNDVGLSSDTGQIYITGHISWWSELSERFAREITLLLGQGVVNVEVYINSPGGSMVEANEIGNQIARFTGKRVCTLGAICASAATVLSTFCTEVRASSNTLYMIHDPWVEATIEHVSDFARHQKMYEILRNDAIDRYVQKTGMGAEEISAMMEATTWMSAKEAEEHGFVDSVLQEADTATAPEDTANALAKMQVSIPAHIKEKLAVNTTAEKPTKPNPKPAMKEVLVQVITAFALSGVTAESPQNEIISALKGKFSALEAENSSLKEDLQAVQANLDAKASELATAQAAAQAHEDNKLKAVLDIAQNDDQKITAAQRSELEKLAKLSNDGFATVLALLETMPARKTLSEQVANSGAAPQTTLSAKVYSRIAKLQAAQ